MRLHVDHLKAVRIDAINAASYLINWGSIVLLKFMILKEAWTRKEIYLSHLKCFGFPSNIYVDQITKDKFNPKSKKCYFIGHGGDEFRYIFWDNKDNKIIRSKNVIFNESISCKDKSNTNIKNKFTPKQI